MNDLRTAGSLARSASATEQLIATYADAWLRGDGAATLACYHEQFTLHYFGRNALSGDHVGKAQAIMTLRELARRTGWQVIAIKRVLTGADGAALVARIRYRSEAAELERDRVLVFAIADGLLRECWAYDEDQLLMDRLIGMSQPR